MSTKNLLRKVWREAEIEAHQNVCLDIYKRDKKLRVNHLLVKLTYMLKNRDINTLISIRYKISKIQDQVLDKTTTNIVIQACQDLHNIQVIRIDLSMKMIKQVVTF